MGSLVALQVIDKFLLNYTVGDVLLLAFVLSVLAALPVGSRRVLALNAILFGVIFLVTPSDLAALHYKFLGIALVFAGPMLFISARR